MIKPGREDGDPVRWQVLLGTTQAKLVRRDFQFRGKICTHASSLTTKDVCRNNV